MSIAMTWILYDIRQGDDLSDLLPADALSCIFIMHTQMLLNIRLMHMMTWNPEVATSLNQLLRSSQHSHFQTHLY
jgi:hypothetical protein